MDLSEIRKKREEGWIDAFFMIETLAIKKDLVENSLKSHIEKLSKVSKIFVYETKFSETKKVQNPLKNIKEAYSQIVDVKLFIKDVPTLINAVILYGPSSVEILGPDKKEFKLGEMQDVSNLLASLVHQFAQSGVGGIIISPKGE